MTEPLQRKITSAGKAALRDVLGALGINAISEDDERIDALISFYFKARDEGSRSVSAGKLPNGDYFEVRAFASMLEFRYAAAVKELFPIKDGSELVLKVYEAVLAEQRLRSELDKTREEAEEFSRGYRNLVRAGVVLMNQLDTYKKRDARLCEIVGTLDGLASPLLAGVIDRLNEAFPLPDTEKETAK